MSSKFFRNNASLCITFTKYELHFLWYTTPSARKLFTKASCPLTAIDHSSSFLPNIASWTALSTSPLLQETLHDFLVLFFDSYVTLNFINQKVRN